MYTFLHIYYKFSETILFQVYQSQTGVLSAHLDAGEVGLSCLWNIIISYLLLKLERILR